MPGVMPGFLVSDFRLGQTKTGAVAG